jgi:eukaryotic-like serine/threonine-protein kinase
MAITDPLVLPDDVLLVTVRELPETLRGELRCDEDDYAVTRPQSRSTSKIIDGNSARLIERFGKPHTIVQAVIDFCRECGSDPEETLEGAYPLIELLLQSGLLVEAGSDKAKKISFTHQPGDSVAGCTIQRCVQLVEDTELYQGELAGGRQVALKIVRLVEGSGREWALRNETAILNHLDGDPAPKLFHSGTFQGRFYIVEEWCQGIESAVVPQRLARMGWMNGRQDLLRLCVGIADAYSRLHARGVLHTDIHPRNILVADDFVTKIIDFGYSCFAANEAARHNHQRPGIPFFFEPEYAKAARANLPFPAPSLLGEQYGVAALLYFLITGAHYLDFSLDRETMLRQISEDGPTPFIRRGIPPWPEVEAVLSRALSKEPGDRYRTMQQFADALREPAGAQYKATPGFEARPLLDRVIESLGLQEPMFEAIWSDAPACSVNSGAAGFAYILYRIACLRQNPELLSLADVWCTKARANVHNPHSFYNASLDVTPETVGRVSPYHTESGVHAVQVLISLAVGDLATAKESTEDFIRAAGGACDNLDLTLGRSGVVLACSLLLEAAGQNAAMQAQLRDFGDRRLAGVWQELDHSIPMDQAPQFAFLGIAHGWAGALYATMRWCGAANRSLPASLLPRLNELAERMGSNERSGQWTRSSSRARTGDPAEYWPGWCAGSAGYVHLWTLAHRTFGGGRYQDLARAAGHAAWNDSTLVGDLCCGLSGRAYGLLNLYKHTGESEWLERARQLADRAVVGIQQYSLRRQSLYKGEIGVALLQADLERPQLSAMPFFEHEGWPAGKNTESRANLLD